MSSTITPNPKLDLVLERIVDVPPELIWKSWTTPELLKKWFTPTPWKTTDCRIDLRPGGGFYTSMEGPNGEGHASEGCYLEIIENRKLVFTDALKSNFRPTGKPNECINNYFTAVVSMEPHGSNGTKYTVVLLHADEEAKRIHEERGFTDGWGTALNQLVTYIKENNM